VTGEIEKEDNVLVIKRIHVTYHLKAAATQRETIDRVHGFHADYCPVARTVRGCIEVTTSLELEETDE